MAGGAKKAAKTGDKQGVAGLVPLTSDIYWEQDRHHRFTEVVGPRTELVEGVRRSLLANRRWDLKYVNMRPSDWAAHRQLLKARRPFRDLELGMVLGTKMIWFSVSGEPVFDTHG